MQIWCERCGAELDAEKRNSRFCSKKCGEKQRHERHRQILGLIRLTDPMDPKKCQEAIIRSKDLL